jgi:hypothetical protein
VAVNCNEVPKGIVGPVGVTAIDTRVGLAIKLNPAATVWLEFIVTVQLAVPEQAPYHPANVEPVVGVAVSATTVPAAKLRQAEPHEVPAGEELTVPLPVPDVVMVRVADPWVELTTVRPVVPVTKPEVAVIVLLPADTPVTKPEALIVAMAVLEELQFTAPVRF